MESDGHLRNLGGLGSGLQGTRSRNCQVCRAEGQSFRRGRGASSGFPALGGARTTGVSSLVLPLASVRRGPAGSRRQRQTSAGADSVRAVVAGGILVQSRVALDPAGNRARLDERIRAAASLPVRDRKPVSAAGTRAG